MGESISKLSKEIRLLKQKLDLEKKLLPSVAYRDTGASILNKAQKDLTKILKKDLSEFENTHFGNNWRGHKIFTFKVPNEIRFEDGKVIIESIRMNPIIDNESFKEIPNVLFNKIKKDLIEFIGEDIEVREISFDYSIYNENFYIETPPEFDGRDEKEFPILEDNEGNIEEEVHYPEQSFLNELRDYTSEAREELLNKTKETLRKYAKEGHYHCPLTELTQMNDEISKVIISRLVCELSIHVYKDNDGVLVADWSEII